jgi:glycopeptide antibiotics resistance protein
LPRAIDPIRLNPYYAWIAGGIALVILYGSFYPFRFYLHHNPRGPLGVLLASGFRMSTPDDVVSNILLYIPFGFFAAYALEHRILSMIAGAALAGFALSLFVELAQFYDLGRVQQISDIGSNSLGALFGAVAAVAARRRVSSVFVALLLFCWFASRGYPATPPGPAMEHGPFLILSSVPPLDLFRYFAEWLAVGLMMETLFGAAPSRVALPLFLAASLLWRAFAVYAEPAEIAGGTAAALLWSAAIWRLPARAKLAAALFVALIVVVALVPFHFRTIPRAFGWVPFRGFLEAGADTAIRVFFEKVFQYGTLVWLLAGAGLSVGVAAALGATLVFCLRFIQVYLPARSAEITDAILLLMLAALMKLLALAKNSSRA